MINENLRQNERLDRKKLFMSNYLRKETAIALFSLAILAFFNVGVTYLFNGTNEYLLLAIFSIISLIIEIASIGSIFYFMTNFENKKYEKFVKKVTMIAIAALSFTTVVKLLIVIIF